MSEQLNAIAQGELVPYSETRRDQLEQELIELDNKKELNRRSNNGITVVAYWLMRENVCLIYVSDERTQSSCEFPVPNDEVMTHFDHPFANAQVDMKQYRQSQNGA